MIPISRLVEDLLDDLERRWGTKPQWAGVPSGIRALDVRMGGFAPRELIVAVGCAAVPFAVAMTRHVAVVLGRPVRVESDDPAGFTTRLLAAEGAISLRRLRQRSLREPEVIALADAVERVAQSPVTFASASEPADGEPPVLAITTGSAVRLPRSSGDAPTLAAVDADRSAFEDFADVVIRFNEEDPLTAHAQVERDGEHVMFLRFAVDECGRLWDPAQH